MVPQYRVLSYGVLLVGFIMMNVGWIFECLASLATRRESPPSPLKRMSPSYDGDHVASICGQQIWETGVFTITGIVITVTILMAAHAIKALAAIIGMGMLGYLTVKAVARAYR